jgi:hypothetical protein
LSGIDFKDGTFGLPCASIVTDINGNPVADGTEVTFSLKISGLQYKRPTAWYNWLNSTDAYYYWIDSTYDLLSFEDFNDNYKLDPGEDRNGDGVASRGEDLDGDGIFSIGPTYDDINKNGKRDYLPGDVVEPSRWAYSIIDSAGNRQMIKYFADFNFNGRCDTIEPLIGQYATMTDEEYTRLLNEYKAAHHGCGYDFDTDPLNGIVDPRTAVSIQRTVQTVGGKATNTILYGQSDARRIEIMVWAESQGVRTISPSQQVLPIIMSK